jgi:hypothetical protein
VVSSGKRAGRLEQALALDGAHCVWCGRPFGKLVPPTTDHLVPRLKGGPSWAANEVAACRRCNAQRGHQSPSAWLEECEGRGWEPRRDIVIRHLLDLNDSIDDRGGQRRAREYLAKQLRRLQHFE